MPQLVYALNKDSRLVHVDNVPNGLMCQCTCPACGEALIAKNNGETKESHFAHYYGTECEGAHETELHLLAKEIIAEEKRIMLPPYGNVFNGGQQTFDFVEVEQGDDNTNLRPDLCGVVRKADGMESRLWIEIKVTHAIGAEKRHLILNNRISCLEINLNRFMEETVSKSALRDFLLCSIEDHEWTNNPTLEERQSRQAHQKREMARMMNDKLRDNDTHSTMERDDAHRKEYLMKNPSHCIVHSSKCMTCKYHTSRMAILEEVRRRHLPSWLKESLSCDLRFLSKENITTTVCFDRCYQIRYEGYVKLLPDSSPDIYGMAVTEREIRQNQQIIPFLLNVVPDILASHTFHCEHNRSSFPSASGKYDIACDCDRVVNRYRKKIVNMRLS